MRRKAAAGFTMVEMLIVLAIIGIVVLLGLPALLAMLQRSKLTNSARETAVLMRLARIEAVKKSRQAGVTAIYADRTIIAFMDNDTNGAFGPGDEELSRTRVVNGVELRGPGDALEGDANAAVGGANFVDTATHATMLFTPTGAAVDIGALRFRGAGAHFLEARVDPRATGRVSVQKYVGDPNNASAGADATNWFEPGENGPWSWDDYGT
jgi:prepilin-type N-terminal cleavage/methylation domain-containing protein